MYDDDDDGFGEDEDMLDGQLAPFRFLQKRNQADASVDSASEPEAFDAISPAIEGE